MIITKFIILEESDKFPNNGWIFPCSSCNEPTSHTIVFPTYNIETPICPICKKLCKTNQQRVLMCTKLIKDGIIINTSHCLQCSKL